MQLLAPGPGFILGIVLGLPFVASVMAAVAGAPVAAPAHAILARQFVVNDWVTVDAEGKPRTVTVTVTTKKGGALSTISAPPYMLTGSVFTVTRDGQVATSTGTPPPPSATAVNGAGGSFAVCHNNEGTDAPFCQPKRGSELSLGKTYYVTWDPTSFGDPNGNVSVQAILNPSPHPVYDSVDVPVTQGYMPFLVESGYLQGRAAQALQLTLTFTDANGEDKPLVGPQFQVVSSDIRITATDPNQSGTGPSQGVVIGTAIAVAAVVIGLLGAGYLLWRKYGARVRMRGIRRRSAQGYGIGKSRSKRVSGSTAATNSTDINLDEQHGSRDIGPSSPPGQNVFQQEILRQDRERQTA